MYLIYVYVYTVYICNSYNTGKSALLDIYARCPRASAYISIIIIIIIITSNDDPKPSTVISDQSPSG